MRKQIFAGMVWATFFTLPPGFCMENEPERMEHKQKSVVKQVLSNPELSIKILGYLSFRRPFYSYSSSAKLLGLCEMLFSFATNQPQSPDFRREGIYTQELDEKIKLIPETNIDEVRQYLYIMDSQDPSVRDQQGLKSTQLVSKQFCDLSRFHIISITSPGWANDDYLNEYAKTLPKLESLTIKSTLRFDLIDSNATHGFVPEDTPYITDVGLENLTILTKLRVKDANEVTDNGLKTLTNLTFLDLEYKWNITDDGLIDEAGQPRHLKLKSLLLPNKHGITEDAINILENHGVTVKESEYSIPTIQVSANFVIDDFVDG